jgi:pimeloyl-ACP methyl ester carboxylesterase
MSRIELCGATFECFEQGSGTPVVLLHSTGASSAQWRALAQRLCSRFHVIAPDLYGYGASANWSGRGVFRLADEARLVHALLDRLDEPAHLVGHSYGGAVALDVARTHGALLRSLTLIEPVAFFLLAIGDAADAAAMREITEVAAVVGRSLACGDYAGGCGHFVDYWSGPGTWARLASEQRDALAARLSKVALDFQATIHEPVHLAELQRIAVPTLLLQGSCTAAPTRRICRRLAHTLPGVRVRTIDGANHMAPFTHRDEVNDLVVANLDATAHERQPAHASVSA